MVKGELSNALQGSAVSGFTRVLDTSLLEPYAEKYFDAVRASSRSARTRRHSRSSSALPGATDHAGDHRRTDEFLAALPEDSAALRRIMLETATA